MRIQAELDLSVLRQLLHDTVNPEAEAVAVTVAEKLIEEGLERGRREGRQRGREEGREEGRTEERRRTVKKVLVRRYGRLSPELITALNAADIVTLEAWFDRLLDGATADELLER